MSACSPQEQLLREIRSYLWPNQDEDWAPGAKELVARIDDVLWSVRSEKGTTTSAPHSIGIDLPAAQTVVVSDDKRETPRTNALAVRDGRASVYEWHELCRQLERELNAARSATVPTGEKT